ncbi:DUF1850 domain-containing protein [Sporosarcina sp. ITBMC105]
MMQKSVWLPILLLILLTSLVSIFLPIHKSFTFTDYRSDHPKTYYVEMENDRNFQIRYVHSIFLTDVIESYQVTETDKLQFLSMQYEDVGIGLPGYAEEGETLVIEDGVYTLSYDDNRIQSFVLFVGDVDADLAFKYRDKEFNLKNYLARGESYKFCVQRLSWYQKMKGVQMNGEQ